MRPDLIIFDCDGVLIDSEGVASTVTARSLSALGWPMTPEQALTRFLGMSIEDIQPLAERAIGHPVPLRWRESLAGELLAALRQDSRLIPGAHEMLEQVNARGIGWRVASNSSAEEMEVKFARTGLADLVPPQNRFAAAASGRPKPAPDVFLAAAGSVAPSNCLVLEDSPLGITGAVAAGMACYGFAPHGDGAALLAAGARRVFRRLNELFEVLE
jgi:HAD superfamily hydrolase (TIGR01509 family)